ncbi:sigma-54-dependent Fis family transcriptional regulator [Aquabacterium sp.]|uniref:sigma-54 interaction domain-containing protein n=1 Tax=Aquabacterium sp. TaxID=1872578 RepID=UPI0025B9C547|nr:sigma-54 dependent transcriptional regulator [Aquabacterium sp.]
MEKVLTLPQSPSAPLSIRAKALVFHDPGSLALLESVERIARSEATVLVTGETGTGKELIARHIHHTSGRRGPFVPVNCGAFSESLIDAELFGHESGAFTGASQARSGWFEAANGGTLFLDEIGDLPMALQVKLLRVLQERQVVRLGSRRAIPLDVRLVAATNIDLARAVEAQHFRADLYYRLSVASVRLPPLRERPADILPLARHFIEVHRTRLGQTDVQITEEAQLALLHYSWPGNIRELENVIHFALIVCRDQLIRTEDIRLVPLVGQAQAPGAPLSVGGLGRVREADTPQRVVPSEVVVAPAEPLAGASVLPGPLDVAAVDVPPLDRLVEAWRALLDAGTPDLFDTVESALIHAAFAHSKQNQVRTAKALGITRNMLRTQLKRHGLLGAQDEGEESEAVNLAQPA